MENEINLAEIQGEGKLHAEEGLVTMDPNVQNNNGKLFNDFKI